MKESKLDNKNKIIPLADRVLVKPLNEADKKSPSGIIIPDTVSKEKPEQGIVIAVGEGKRDDSGKLVPIHVKVGDKILFSKYGFDEVKFDDEEYFILREDSILAILKN
jgi:chaperonin GroES